MSMNEREQRWWDALAAAINFWDDEFDLEAIMSVADAEQEALRFRLKVLSSKWAWQYDEAVANGAATPVHAALLGAAQAIDDALAGDA